MTWKVCPICKIFPRGLGKKVFSGKMLMPTHNYDRESTKLYQRP